MKDLKNKRNSFGYEDTDKNIEIELYGLVFEINDIGSIKEFKDLENEDENVIEAQIEKILGEGAVEKINRKREKDGYKKLDLSIELNILGCIFETYANSMSDSVLGKVTRAVDNMDKNMDNAINMKQRKNYNKTVQYRNRGYRRY